MKKITDYFDKVYVINLPYRTDRRNEINEQLASIGTSLDDNTINLFSAIRPEEPGEFDSIGTKGAFLSHLAVLKDAKAQGYERILVLEDDVNFVKNFKDKVNETIDKLATHDWHFFYGGHRLNFDDKQENIVPVPASTDIVTAHFMALQGQTTIETLIDELQLMLGRKNGDANGGPMHVDGAYSTVRRNYDEYITYAANPPLGNQRASRTDIHDHKWFDKTPGVKQVVAVIRKLKNNLMFSMVA